MALPDKLADENKIPSLHCTIGISCTFTIRLNTAVSHSDTRRSAVRTVTKSLGRGQTILFTQVFIRQTDLCQNAGARARGNAPNLGTPSWCSLIHSAYFIKDTISIWFARSGYRSLPEKSLHCTSPQRHLSAACGLHWCAKPHLSSAYFGDTPRHIWGTVATLAGTKIRMFK